nr:hypothetical protein Iba_scaffold36637CG0010 [Ipomoea batatas]GMD39514.1 hypothetical protein Iba_chr10aCG0480 [Ipomoea batatas]GMD41565.1 hypothetical protein Iba_chr10bCG0920 [Ipomoea batatas]
MPLSRIEAMTFRLSGMVMLDRFLSTAQSTLLKQLTGTLLPSIPFMEEGTLWNCTCFT